jgi:hypothetical protein
MIEILFVFSTTLYAVAAVLAGWADSHVPIALTLLKTAGDVIPSPLLLSVVPLSQMVRENTAKPIAAIRARLNTLRVFFIENSLPNLHPGMVKDVSANSLGF